MDEGSDVFAAFRKQVAIGHAVRRQASFEERCVKLILRSAGVPVYWKAAREDARATFRTDHLTFAWLLHKYPGFPMKLGAAKLRDTSGTKIGWTDLFGSNFRKLPWMREYEQMALQWGWDAIADRVGLVFNAPHADKAALMVMHNMPHQLGLPDPESKQDGETRIVRSYKRPEVTYVIESFRGFLTTIGRGWEANG